MVLLTTVSLPSRSMATRLELQLQRELNLALRNHRRCNHARSAGSIGNVVIGLRKDGVVEGVKELCAKLETNLLGDVEVLAGGQVRAFLPWALQNVLPGIAEVTHRNRKIVDVKPQVGPGIRHVTASSAIRSQ